MVAAYRACASSLLRPEQRHARCWRSDRMRTAPADRRTHDVAALLSVIALVAAVTSAAAGFVPGGGPERTDCYTQLYVEGVDYPGPQVRAKRFVTCTDGDPCDQDVRQRSSEPQRQNGQAPPGPPLIHDG